MFGRRFWTITSLYGVLIAATVPLALRLVPPNGWYGFRLPGALIDVQSWYEVNALGGKQDGVNLEFAYGRLREGERGTVASECDIPCLGNEELSLHACTVWLNAERRKVSTNGNGKLPPSDVTAHSVPSIHLTTPHLARWVRRVAEVPELNREWVNQGGVFEE